MAVSKELLARYKEMKAAGISITLAELKAQMEAEEKSSAANLQTQDNTQLQPNIENENNNYINNYNSPQNITTITETQSQTEQNNTIQNPASTQNNIYAEQYSNYSNNFNANYSNYMNTASTPESYSNSQTTNTPTQTTLQQNQMQETITNETSTNLPDAINAPTKKFAVIGYPLGHSLSGYMHDAGFKSLGLKASYEVLETPPETLVDRIKFFKTHNYSGFNVTIPLKLPVIMFLDEVDESDRKSVV